MMQEEMKEIWREIVREEIRKALLGRGVSNDLRTREEAAVILGIKPQTLAVWATKNLGPAPTKIGSCVRYQVTEIEAFISKNTMPR